MTSAGGMSWLVERPVEVLPLVGAGVGAELGVGAGVGAGLLGCADHAEDCPGVGVVNVGGSGIGLGL